MRFPKPIPTEQQNILKGCLKRAKTKADFQRIQCVWLRAVLSLRAEQIAVVVGWSVSRVKRIQGQFFREGEKALFGPGRGGRHHENLSLEAEERFLMQFLEKAKTGGVLEVSEIKAAYERTVGHAVPQSTIYRMLTRHGWRKIAPRPRHPRSDIAQQEAWKKNSRSG